MNKKDFIHRLAQKTNITDDFAAQFLNATIETLNEIMIVGDSITTLQGLGTFTVARRNARKGRDPSTGALLGIPAKAVPQFKLDS